MARGRMIPGLFLVLFVLGAGRAAAGLAETDCSGCRIELHNTLPKKRFIVIDNQMFNASGQCVGQRPRCHGEPCLLWSMLVLVKNKSGAAVTFGDGSTIIPHGSTFAWSSGDTPHFLACGTVHVGLALRTVGGRQLGELGARCSSCQ